MHRHSVHGSSLGSVRPLTWRRHAATAAAAIAVAALTLTLPSTAGASTAAVADVPEEHCVIDVDGQTRTGEFIIGEFTCVSSPTAASLIASVNAASDLAGDSEASSTTSGTGGVAALTFTLAIHYEGANLTGSSLTITGANCAGGYLNLPAAWDNRISSTLGGCPRVRHWTGLNKTGSSQDTVPNGNLVAPVDNASTSVQYMT